jgi:hypothetical protein
MLYGRSILSNKAMPAAAGLGASVAGKHRAVPSFPMPCGEGSRAAAAVGVVHSTITTIKTTGIKTIPA